MKKILLIPILLVVLMLILFAIFYFSAGTSTDHKDLAQFEGYVVVKEIQKQDVYRVLLMLGKNRLHHDLPPIYRWHVAHC